MKTAVIILAIVGMLLNIILAAYSHNVHSVVGWSGMLIVYAVFQFVPYLKNEEK